MYAFLASRDKFVGKGVGYMHLGHNSRRIIPASLHPSGHPGSVFAFASLHLCLLLRHVNPLPSYVQVSLIMWATMGVRQMCVDIFARSWDSTRAL